MNHDDQEKLRTLEYLLEDMHVGMCLGVRYAYGYCRCKRCEALEIVRGMRKVVVATPGELEVT